ncbi:NmrA family NAD(P)-binding protein [Mucilaginibacter sp. UR6-1]|uniref:NmrA family NAD(P)-binding protein n=1 Tax=Mucilaginibacter sp. UR6-1 TaxID=1435643 RepID=UPI001E586EA6|nr:NmrA family NAD(P)-binding protein [Mucilaginibacter sp. UR6-1]MCC8410768.1 NmrA family NAD(P)-binding protein [Mucilaginibacter sp. UR6-1]
MKNTILLAGATGDLGGKICLALIKRGAHVRLLIREGSNHDRVHNLSQAGAEVITVNYGDEAALISACDNVSCVVSALAGLYDVIVTAQTLLLNAALKAGVKRFIPSDFCTDFTQLQKGDNRNFDLRKEFQEILDSAEIHATSIFNGAFTYVLQNNIPLLDTKERSIAYFQDKLDWKIDFTTVTNTAEYTAAVALDDSSPRFLNIASFRVSPHELAELTRKVFGAKFELKERGPINYFADYIRKIRQEQADGEKQLYPQWQQMQYLHSMFTAHHKEINNDRYDISNWTSAEQTLKDLFQKDKI